MARIRKLFLLLAAGCFLALSASGAGVTIITHGLNGNVDGWATGMADRIPVYPLFSGTNYSGYEIYFTASNNAYVPTWRRVRGAPPQNTDSGEIVIKLDWRQLANDDYNTYEVAAAVAPVLMQSGFISEWPGHALSELPLHLVGHSRGGSLVCELSKLLGANGVWVDHLTTLDPHPLNNDGFNDFPYSQVDAPARTYENVLFHDNYFQELNFVAYGEPVAGAYIRQLTSLNGGYGGITASHSDVHLWYHGTVDFRVPASDTEASITDAERRSWWTVPEEFGVRAGFHYSLLGRGDRMTNARPDGPGTSAIRDGFNQKWDLGGGTNVNRTSLTLNNGRWPNLLRFNLLTTNLVAHGDTNLIQFYFQWAQPTNLQARVSIYADDDYNPFNGNEAWVWDFFPSATTASQVLQRTARVIFNATNATPGSHTLFARVSANNRARYLYAPEVVRVTPSFAAPRLAIQRQSVTNVLVTITAVAGQRVVLESSPDLASWAAIATNSFAATAWQYTAPVLDNHFFRAAVR